MASNRAQALDAFFFGTPPALFAAYHPARGRPRGPGVVLCPALGHEYVRAHRAYRNLAQALSRAGLPVLRFDYWATGDSAGESGAGTPDRWVQDVHAAIDVLKARAAVSQVGLVGLRFGAAVAALASAARPDVDRLLLWDPVLRGRDYLDELDQLQVDWLRDRLGTAGDGLAGDELLGLPAPAAFRDAVAAIDLAAEPTLRAGRVYVVVTGPREDCVTWHGTLKARGVPAGLAQVASAGGWRNPEAVHQLLLPHEAIKLLVELAGAA